MGGWFGTTGLFLVTPLLGGLALVLLYAWATTVVGPRWAGVATAVAGASMPFMVFARDTYSEQVAMAFVFGGLWLLHVASRAGDRKSGGWGKGVSGRVDLGGGWIINNNNDKESKQQMILAAKKSPATRI